MLGIKTNEKHRIPFDWMRGRWINGRMDSKTLSDNGIWCTRCIIFLKELLTEFRMKKMMIRLTLATVATRKKNCNFAHVTGFGFLGVT